MKIKLKQVRSAIGTTKKQKDNLRSLKLGRIGKIAIFDDSTKEFQGRLAIVKHLVAIENVEEVDQSKKESKKAKV